jgi:hypothetical protein
MNKKSIIEKKCKSLSLMIVVLLLTFGLAAKGQWNFKTNYFKIQIDNKGFITSMKNSMVTPNREFSPADKPSPLLCLYNYKNGKYFYPEKVF